MMIESANVVQNPLVSVVIATYNQKDYIEETIKSALSQTCNFPFEILVGDDGSNDGERDLLIELQKQYPGQLRLIFNEQNMRVTKNYVNVIRHARGKYIAPLDGDDFWNQADKLQKQVDFLESSPEISCIHTGYIKQFDGTDTSTSIAYWNSPLTTSWGKQAMIAVIREKFSHFPVFSSMLFKKERVSNYDGFINRQINSPFTRGEGMIFFTILANEGKWAFMNEPLTTYRILDESTCHIKDANENAKFQLFYLFQKLSVARELNLGFFTTWFLNLKILKFLFFYTKNCDRNIIRGYYNDYSQSEHCELNIIIKLLLMLY